MNSGVGIMYQWRSCAIIILLLLFSVTEAVHADTYTGLMNITWTSGGWPSYEHESVRLDTKTPAFVSGDRGSMHYGCYIEFLPEKDPVPAEEGGLLSTPSFYDVFVTMTRMSDKHEFPRVPVDGVKFVQKSTINGNWSLNWHVTFDAAKIVGDDDLDGIPNDQEEPECPYCNKPESECVCERCPYCGKKVPECVCEKCPYCGKPEPGCVCERCPYCNQKEPECICQKCPYCNKKEQDCICEKCPYCYNKEPACTCPKCLYCNKKEPDCVCEKCPYCNKKEPECVCPICPDCQQKEPECICPKCPYCNKKVPECICGPDTDGDGIPDKYEKDDDDDGGGGGGGDDPGDDPGDDDDPNNPVTQCTCGACCSCTCTCGKWNHKLHGSCVGHCQHNCWGDDCPVVKGMLSGSGGRYVHCECHHVDPPKEEPPKDIILDRPPSLNYTMPDFTIPSPRSEVFVAPTKPDRETMPTIEFPKELDLPQPPSVPRNNLLYFDRFNGGSGQLPTFKGERVFADTKKKLAEKIPLNLFQILARGGGSATGIDLTLRFDMSVFGGKGKVLEYDLKRYLLDFERTPSALLIRQVLLFIVTLYSLYAIMGVVFQAK